MKARQIKLLQWSKQGVNFVKRNSERPQQEKILLATESYFSTLFKSYFHSALTLSPANFPWAFFLKTVNSQVGNTIYRVPIFKLDFRHERVIFL